MSKGAYNNLRKELGNFCYLGGHDCKYNKLTIHEINPRRCGGLRIYFNTALLCRLEHDYYNAFELIRPREVKEIQAYFHHVRDTRELDEMLDRREHIINTVEREGGYTSYRKGGVYVLKRSI